jgi:hypothetical protein
MATIDADPTNPDHFKMTRVLLRDRVVSIRRCRRRSLATPQYFHRVRCELQHLSIDRESAA